jgi:acylpyruvate hydrolase
MMPMNIWAVGRNYADHAKELNNPIPSTPMIFLKSGACLTEDSDILLPDWDSEIHYELELILKLGQELAPTHFALALDLTDRKAQQKAKAEGLPWTQAKSFKNSCPKTPWIDWNPNKWEKIRFSLKIDGTLVQSGHPGQMIFSWQSLLEHVKKYYPVQPGDLLLTGTPAGVGPLVNGQKLEAFLNESKVFTWLIKRP